MSMAMRVHEDKDNIGEGSIKILFLLYVNRNKPIYNRRTREQTLPLTWEQWRIQRGFTQTSSSAPVFRYPMKVELFGLSETKLFRFHGIFKINEIKKKHTHTFIYILSSNPGSTPGEGLIKSQRFAPWLQLSARVTSNVQHPFVFAKHREIRRKICFCLYFVNSKSL